MDRKSDIVALMRLFEYLQQEVARLGLHDTARSVDVLAASCAREAGARLGLTLEESQQP
jgi:hypothetical protein